MEETNMTDFLENHYWSFYNLGLRLTVPVSPIETTQDDSHPRKRKRRGFVETLYNMNRMMEWLGNSAHASSWV